MIQKIPLSVYEAAVHGATHKVIVDYAELTEDTVNTDQVIALFTAGAGRAVKFVKHRLTVPFKDASDSAFNTTALTIGDTGDPDRLGASTELNENGTEIDQNLANTDAYRYASATAVNATFGSMSGKALEDIDTGKVEMFFIIE